MLSLPYMWSYFVKYIKRPHHNYAPSFTKYALIYVYYFLLGFYCCRKWDCVAHAVIQYRVFLPLFFKVVSNFQIILNSVFLVVAGYPLSIVYLNYEFKVKLLFGQFANWK